MSQKWALGERGILQVTWAGLLVSACMVGPSSKADPAGDSSTDSPALSDSSLPDTSVPTDSGGPFLPWYRDGDGDGYGDPAILTNATSPPDGYVANASDCDDDRAEVNPGAEERCNSLDDDCSGEVDEESVDASIWYFDLDADGFGDPATTQTACDAPDSTWLLDGSDCEDSRADAFPGGLEVCGDGADNDCLGDGDMRCRPEGDISLADAELRLVGSSEGQRAGYMVSIGGDPQGTGTAAVLVYSPGTGVLPDGGTVTLVTPGTEGTVDLLHAGINLYGSSTEADWMLGGGMTIVGDLNLDGYDDLVVRNDPGVEVYAFFGPLTDGDTPADADLVLQDDTYTGIGSNSVAVGDMNGDGFFEIATSGTGSNYDSSWGWTRDAGHVVVMPGSAVPTQLTSDAVAVLRPHPIFAGLQMGRAVDASDLDGDGVMDLVIGAPAPSIESLMPCRENGTVYVAYGPFSGDIILDDADCNLAGADAIWEGPDTLWYGGYSVSSRGDENGDGLSDLLVGAPDFRGGPGWAFLIHGPTTGLHGFDEANWAFTSELETDNAGFAVSMVSDLDADGAADIAISSIGPAAGGRVSLFYGGVLSGSADPTLANATFSGEDPYDKAVYLAGGGDTDADGFDDLLIGAPYQSDIEFRAGAAYMIFGGALP